MIDYNYKLPLMHVLVYVNNSESDIKSSLINLFYDKSNWVGNPVINFIRDKIYSVKIYTLIFIFT